MTAAAAVTWTVRQTVEIGAHLVHGQVTLDGPERAARLAWQLATAGATVHVQPSTCSPAGSMPGGEVR